jgi:hypothetical protein
MAQKSHLKLLNEALGLCSLEQIPFNEPGSRQTFGFGTDSLNIIGDDNLRSFDDIVNKLLQSDRDIENTLSPKELISLLIPVLRKKKKAGVDFTQVECDHFWEKVTSIPVLDFRVLRDLYGASISIQDDPFLISCFKIYDWKNHKNLIVAAELKDDSLIWDKSAHGLLIECTVRARDKQKALELADILFSRFELIIWFMIGYRTDRFDVSILNYTGSKLTQYYMFTRDNFHKGRGRTGPIEALPLDDVFFSKPSPEFTRLLAIIDHQSNALERKLLRCVEWVGQSLMDSNPASAFVKAATALEVLFSETEKGLITPSIMAQISESCALLLGGDLKSRMKIEKHVKRLYGIRSSVVHFGEDTVPRDDLNLLIHIAKAVVLTLLSDAMYGRIQSVKELHAYLKAKKYS